MEAEAKRRAALFAAVSALGLSLGVTVPSRADESPKENRYASHIKGESQQIKISSQQHKSVSGQIKADSQHIKLQGSHIKGEGSQIKTGE